MRYENEYDLSSFIIMGAQWSQDTFIQSDGISKASTVQPSHTLCVRAPLALRCPSTTCSDATYRAKPKAKRCGVRGADRGHRAGAGCTVSTTAWNSWTSWLDSDVDPGSCGARGRAGAVGRSRSQVTSGNSVQDVQVPLQVPCIHQKMLRFEPFNASYYVTLLRV
jgi:hypothetical protein